ncbi:hypothetical protein ACP4OV_012902 [Aristida adscensionis]
MGGSGKLRGKVDKDAYFLHNGFFARDFMEAGGCFDEFTKARTTCEAAAEGEANGGGGGVEACVRATAALRRCMVANEAFFRHYIRAMEEGIEENKRSGYGKYRSEDSTKWRWWCNMRRRYW